MSALFYFEYKNQIIFSEIFNELHEQVEFSREDDKFKTEQINLSEMLDFYLKIKKFTVKNFILNKKFIKLS